MNDSERVNHWNSLAADLGAEVPSEPEPEQDVPQTAEPDEAIGDSPTAGGHQEGPGQAQEAVSTAGRERKPWSKPKVTPGHWSALAGELGLESPTEPDSAETSSSSIELPEATGALPESAEAPAEMPAEVPTEMPAETFPDDPTDEMPPVDDAQAVVDEPPAKSQISSFDFGFGLIEAEDTRDELFIEEAEVAMEEQTADESFDQDSADSALVEDTVEVADAEDAAGPDPTKEGEPQAKRRRRRRGRRKRKSDAPAEGKAEDPGKGAPAQADDEGADEISPDRAESGGTEAPTSDGDSEASVKSAETKEETASRKTADGGKDPGAGRPSHRQIPSWQDAIDLIISVNMDSRGKSPTDGGRRSGSRSGKGGKGGKGGRGKGGRGAASGKSKKKS